jgi:Dyp-type peroxidase family
MSASKQTIAWDDIQGLLRFGFGHLKAASFLLLKIKHREAARQWLANTPVTSAVSVDPRPKNALQIALTSEGLEALGVAPDIIRQFSHEYVVGMSADPNRSMRLGDVAHNAPERWAWGAKHDVPHVLVMLYATPGELEAFRQSILAQLSAGFEIFQRLSTAELVGKEPFGFEDGISQPKLDWERVRPVGDEERHAYINLSCLGEFLLGYPNEYGMYTHRPLLDPLQEHAALLPRAEDAPHKADLGCNGSYLVLRQLQQDVHGFWQYVDQQAGGDAAQRERLAAAMVGRTRDGEPLLGRTKEVIAGNTPLPEGGNNAFTYQSDREGLRCPLGAHIRRSNPRNADLPPGNLDIVSRLIRTLGFDASARENDLVASTRFHRLLRRGRSYGARLAPDAALTATSAQPETGIHFVSLGASIGRQFEFVQGAWIAGTKFAGLPSEGDPLLGHRQPGADGCPSDGYSIPQVRGPDQRLSGMPPFVTVRGGAYFFLPGIRALHYLATAPGELELARNSAPMETAMDSNASRPVPPANTGSTLLNWISDISMLLVQMERRIDPFIRPAFDAVLREPLARFVTWLINLQRKNEGLKIAEEKPLPNEEANLDAIVDTFKKQMSGLWKPGGFERGGNTKTQGIVRAELIVNDNLPPKLRKGIFAVRRSYPAWVRFSGPGPYVTPDIDDVGFMSISVKVMDVPGPKLMEEEKHTQDMFGVSPPTFVTGDTYANAHLQEWSLKNASLFHFINFKRPHVLDLIMQGLYIKTQSSPFEAPYFSCVPYLMGEGQAMMYSFWPVSSRKAPIPRLPLRPPDDYLRNAMVAALDEGDVELDVRVQLQTDPHLMPIENASVLWPERLSPRVSVATLRIPKQTFNSPEQMAFARRLSFNPWHCIADHRPLGNQSRARKRMYYELSQYRHQMNKVPHFEPDGSERFP